MHFELMVGINSGEGDGEHRMAWPVCHGGWSLTWPPGNGEGQSLCQEACDGGSGFGDTSDGDGAGGAAPKW